MKETRKYSLSWFHHPDFIKTEAKMITPHSSKHISSRFAACMRKITPTFICTPKRNNDRNLLLSTETNATNTNGFRCLQEIMKQVCYKLYTK